jgi:hypothetical protein
MYCSIHRNPASTVLLHNGGFFNTCTMKRCLHRNVDFKTNALNNAHVSQLLHYKQDCYKTTVLFYTCRSKQNHSKKSQNNTWPSVLSGCTFHYMNQIIFKTPFPSTLLNVNLVKYGPKNVYKIKSFKAQLLSFAVIT